MFCSNQKPEKLLSVENYKKTVLGLSCVGMEENLTDQSFKDTIFLESFGLSPWNVLDYFSKSQFYDSSCINEQVKMQQRFNTLNVSAEGLLGSSYELWYYTETPSLFVIKKLNKSLNSVKLTGIYYIIQGTIYQAPLLSSVLKNRLSTCLYYLQSAFEKLEESNAKDYQKLQGLSVMNLVNFKLNQRVSNLLNE